MTRSRPLITLRDAVRQNVFWPLLFLVLLVGAAAYWRGLGGVFLFDDFANLPVLGAFGPVDNSTAFVRYITSGGGDPTGRPLALLTFLIDGHNWPTDPYPFKRTNLILHLLNGVLLAVLLRRLGRLACADQPRRADFAAIVGASLWLLHPLLVSTTLYVVQREAMLPATFMLLGLIGYCRGRERLALGDARGAWSCAAAIGGATVFAIASKANGVLLPLLALIVDRIALAPLQAIPERTARAYRFVRYAVLGVPTAIVVAYLVFEGVHLTLHGVPSVRPWTLPQRLMTEARVVCDYLSLLWLPHPYTAGLFNDAVKVSTGLLSPTTTLPAILFIGALVVLGVFLRRRAPAWALAILFYFAAQLLESTVVPLELYYEHRNYVPALLLFWPLALWLSAPAEDSRLRIGLAVVLIAMLAGMTAMNADLWGNASEQALLWAQKNPDSPRAQAYAAAAERALGHPERAAERMRRVRIDPGEDIQIALNQAGAECELGEVAAPTLERAANALRTARTAGRLYFEWMSGAIARVANGTACRGLGLPEVSRLLDAMDENPNMRGHGGWQQDNLSLRASVDLVRGDVKAALADFNAALAADPRAEAALVQAAQLGGAGFPAAGVEHLDFYLKLPKPAPAWQWNMASIHARLLQRDDYLEQEIARLRGVLQQEAQGSAALKTPT